MSMPQVKGQGRSGCRGGGRGLLHALPAEREAKSQGRQRKRVVGPPVQSHWASSPQSPFPSSSRRHCLSLWLKGFQMGVPVRRNVTDRCRKNSLTPSGSQDLRDTKFF